MIGTIPRLRRAGWHVERTRRPLSRGMRYRVSNAADECAGIVYSIHELEQLAAHLLDGAPRPKPRMIGPTGKNSANVRPRCRYL